MTDRARKKWLKKNNKYINSKDTWNLDYTIAEFVLPRLKLFKKQNNGYPGYGEADTFEKWNIIIDKMIIAFELLLENDYNYDKYWINGALNTKLIEEDNAKIEEGLMLFAKWFRGLWW